MSTLLRPCNITHFSKLTLHFKGFVIKLHLKVYVVYINNIKRN